MNILLKDKKIFKLLLLSVTGVLSGSLAAPIEIHFIRKIVGSDSLASYAFTIATIASVFGVLLIARLANSVGRKKVIYWAFFFNIVFPLYYSTVLGILQLYGVKFVWSFVMAGAGTLLGAFIQQEVAGFQEMSGRFYGIMYALQSGAGSLGVIIGGIVSDFFGITSVYYVVFGINIIQFLLIMSLVKKDEEVHKQNKEQEKKQGSIIEGVKFIWQNSELRARFILITSFGINWSSDAILYPIIILSITGANTSTGVIWAIQGIIGMIILPIIGKIVDDKGYAWVLITGYIILGLGIIAFSLSHYFWMLLIAAAFVSVGKSANGPAMSTLEVKNIPEHLRNSVVAVHNAYSTIVEVATTFAIGLFIKYASPQNIMFYLGIAVLLAIVIAEFSMKAKVKEA